ncbi:transcriptional repressor LexA [Planctomycetota bacterium]
MKPITKKQKMILDFITKRLADQGRPPSQREIGAQYGLAQNSVFQFLNYLKQKGYLEDDGGHRGIRLSRRYARAVQKTEGMPVVGRVAAGMPILAEENVDEYLDLPNMVKRTKATFTLKVTGDSMVDDGIMDGDYVLVRPRRDIESGRIGVVLIDDEATVKRVFKQKTRIVLKPANKKAGYKPIYVSNAESLRIVGEVVGCVRTEIA